VTLAERRNGTSWKIQSMPDPSVKSDPYPREDNASELYGVSCTAPNACIAVGNYYNYNAHGVVPLAERWNGASWKIQATPNVGPANPDSHLYGVSCTAANACLAVGDYVNAAGKEVTLRWNGTSWNIQPMPTPAAATSTTLEGVSCTAANVCTAVGYYTNAAGKDVKLAERWNGASWKIQATPNPAGAKGSDLYGVSCAGANACLAVGYYTNAAGKDVMLAERWSGAG
jgi:hypothetical protein